MQKIPVRIVQTKDIHGNKKVGVMLDISYYQDSGGDPDAKVKKFKNLYFDTIKEARKLYRATKRKGAKNSKYYWKLSNLLQQFNGKTENEFEITNYRTALQRDFGLTDSYVGVIFDFGKFFAEEEVLDKIPMSVYFELTLKKRQLDKFGLFEEKKSRLLKMTTEGKVPGHKEYRQKLKDLISASGTRTSIKHGYH